jgi:hypothetical protein
VATIWELAADDSDALKAAIQAELRTIFTALPAIITSSDQHTANANSAINGLVRNPDGTMSYVPPPPFQTMPVHFAGGGQVTSTHPVLSGDEGIALFFARNVDSWHQAGGQQTPLDARQHNPSDSAYLGGIKSDPNTIPNPQPDSFQHRSLDGRITHDVHPTNGLTSKVVPTSDPSTNPFISASTFYQTIHNAVSGLIHSAVSGGATHLVSLTHAAGALLSANNGAHTVNVHPTNGIASATTASITSAAQQNITQNAAQNLEQIAGQSLSLTAGTSLSLSAPSLNLPAGGVQSSALAAGAASSNVGALGGDLSGTLPDPNVVGITHVADGNALPQYANNAAAIASSVPVGELYLNTSIAAGELVICVAH